MVHARLHPNEQAHMETTESSTEPTRTSQGNSRLPFWAVLSPRYKELALREFLIVNFYKSNYLSGDKFHLFVTVPILGSIFDCLYPGILLSYSSAYVSEKVCGKSDRATMPTTKRYCTLVVNLRNPWHVKRQSTQGKG